MPVSGLAVAEIAAGGVLLYSGIKGSTIAATLTALAKGRQPAATETVSQGTAASGVSVPAGNTGAASSSAAANQATAKQVLDAVGLSSWTTGQEWADLVSLWNQESGWNSSAANSSSGAYGIAQALGHGGTGTAGSVTNEYGGYGLTSAEAQAANSGSAAAQIAWGIAYIEQTYGSPVMAWAHETANNWY